jgi:hypothetical protein
MHDNEENFIVAVRQGILAIEQAIQGKIFAIGHGLRQVPMDALSRQVDRSGSGRRVRIGRHCRIL